MIKVCDGDFSHTIMHSDSNGSSYLWSNGDTSTLIQIETSGIYSVTVTHDNGDSSITNYQVIEWGKPSLEWTESHSDSTYFFSVEGDFIDSLTTIKWIIDSTLYLGKSVDHTFPWLNSATSFSLYITAENQCGLAEVFDETCVGLGFGQEPCYPVGLKTVTNVLVDIYPTPTNGHVFLQLNETRLRSVHIVSSDGRIIERFVNTNRSVDLSHLANGLYWLEIETSEGMILRKQLLLSK